MLEIYFIRNKSELQYGNLKSFIPRLFSQIAYLTTHAFCKHALVYDGTLLHTSNMAAVTIIDRMTSLLPLQVRASATVIPSFQPTWCTDSEQLFQSVLKIVDHYFTLLFHRLNSRQCYIVG